MAVDRRDLVQAAGWVAGAWLLWRVSTIPATTEDQADTQSVSVIIPARDEAAALSGLLADLAAQTRRPEEVLVIDDASLDATAATARQHGATVVTSGPLPEGWTGKTWACHQGAAVASGDVLMFLDADVRLAPGAIRRMIGWLKDGGGLVSVQPYHTVERAYEGLSAVANVVALMGSGAFTGPPRQRPTVAFGPCLALSRADYERVGGHAHPAVRHRVTEDIGLAGRVGATGRPVRVAAGRNMVRFRMYPAGFCQLVDGWTKMLAAGAAATPPPLAAAVSLWITGGLVAAGAGLRWARHPHRWRDGAWYAAWAAQMGWLFRRAGRFGPATAAAFPLPLVAFVALFARSALAAVLRRPVRWRGRTVTVRARGAPAAARHAPA